MTPSRETALARAFPINEDGSLIAVGADGKNSGAGAVYCILYDLADNCRTVKVSGGGAPKGIGLSVAISADGGTIAAGALGSNRGGAVATYRSTTLDWTDAENLDNFTPKAGSVNMERRLHGIQRGPRG